VFDDRLSGFIERLAEANYTPRCDEIKRPRQNPVRAQKLMQYINTLPRPLAIFWVADHDALEAEQAFRESGILIPSEISLLTVNDDDIAFEMPVIQVSSIITDSLTIGYSATLDVESMSARFGLSSSAFTRRFRKAFGQTPYQYLIQVRLKHAHALLRQTDRRIADIAQAVGYQDAKLFSAAFRKAFNCTAQAVRNSSQPSSAGF